MNIHNNNQLKSFFASIYFILFTKLYYLKRNVDFKASIKRESMHLYILNTSRQKLNFLICVYTAKKAKKKLCLAFRGSVQVKIDKVAKKGKKQGYWQREYSLVDSEKYWATFCGQKRSSRYHQEGVPCSQRLYPSENR